MKALLCTTALLLGLAAVPAGADDVAPQGTDACGDGGTAVTGPAGRTEVEPAGTGQDLRSATVRVVRPSGGEAVLLTTLRTCGPASEGADYALSWDYADGCTIVLRRPRAVVGQAPSNVLELDCPSSGPIADPRVEADLPDDVFSVVDDAAVFRVPLALVPPEVLPRLAPGATWTTTRASASAPPTVTDGYGFSARSGELDLSTDVSLRFDGLVGGGGTVEQPQG